MSISLATSAAVGLIVATSLIIWGDYQDVQPVSPAPPLSQVVNTYHRGGFQAGVAVVLYKHDYADLAELGAKLDTLFDRLVAINVNAVSLDWPIYTGGLYSSQIFRGTGTPEDSAIALFIDKARQHNFAVMLRPLLDEHSIIRYGKTEYRGTIRPSNIGAWFRNYDALIDEYADLAEAHHATIFAVGSEFVSMEKYTSYWRDLVHQVRKRFTGALTYSSNRYISPHIPWNDLDFIGVDAFFELQTPEIADAQTIQAAWKKWQDPMLKQAASIGKPLVFTELGSASQQGAHRKAWSWNRTSPVDLEDQRAYYQASCTVWSNHIDGIYWWAANIWQPANPLQDTGFNPLQKPAEKVIAQCFKAREAH